MSIRDLGKYNLYSSGKSIRFLYRFAQIKNIWTIQIIATFQMTLRQMIMDKMFEM